RKGAGFSSEPHVTRRFSPSERPRDDGLLGCGELLVAEGTALMKLMEFLELISDVHGAPSCCRLLSIPPPNGQAQRRWGLGLASTEDGVEAPNVRCSFLFRSSSCG